MTRSNRRRRGTAVVAVAAAVAAGAAGLTAVPAQAAPRVPALPGDFNGDGHRDLALGSTSGTVDGVRGAGFVTVVYGGASGPDATKRQVISEDSPGIPGSSQEYGHFGGSLASADFDLDGYADLAVTSPDDASLEGGRVTLIYGSADGLSSKAVSLTSEGGGSPHPATAAAGDFDHDGRPELVIGSGGIGQFTVYSGLASGDLTGKTTSVGTRLGEFVQVSTATADLTGDGYTDLAIGFKWTAVDGDGEWMRLNVYKGSASGLVTTTPAFTASDVRVKSLAAGDVDGDGKADLVAGVASGTGGEVRVFPGTASGVGSPTVIDQATDGVPGAQEPGDNFGASVAAGDINGDGKADIAVGAPDETVGTVRGAGAATVLYGGPNGVTGAGAQRFDQSSAGIPGTPEEMDMFGSQVLLTDLNGDGKADLGIGAPYEDGVEGALVTLNGGASGVTTTGLKRFDSSDLGVQDRSAQIGGVILP